MFDFADERETRAATELQLPSDAGRTKYRIDFRGLRPETESQDLRHLVEKNLRIRVPYARTERGTGNGLVEVASEHDLALAIRSLPKVIELGGNRVSVSRHVVSEMEMRKEEVWRRAIAAAESEEVRHAMNVNDDKSPLARLAKPSADLGALVRASSDPDGREMDKMYVTPTISQDLSGSAEEIISLRLAALGAIQRG